MSDDGLLATVDQLRRDLVARWRIPTRICLREMFQPNFIYELTYTHDDQ